MKVKDVMTEEVEMLSPDTKIVEAAKKMKGLNTGAIPVADGDRIQGILTDRDIVIRCLAEDKDISRCTAREIMTSPIQYIFDDQDIEEAADRMRNQQVRRLVVVNRRKRLVGIVSLGDLALEGGDEKLSGRVLKDVSFGAKRPMHSEISSLRT